MTTKQHRLHKQLPRQKHIAYEMDIATSLTEFLNPCWYEGDWNHHHQEGYPCEVCSDIRKIKAKYILSDGYIEVSGWWEILHEQGYTFNI